MHKNLKLIDSFETLCSFNSYRAKRNEDLFEVSLKDVSKEHIEQFLIMFLENKNYHIIESEEFFDLQNYDFSRLYYKTHKGEFLRRLKEYVNNIVLIGESSFTLWDFEISILKEGLEIKKYIGERRNLEIPEGITHIGEKVFANKKNIQSISFPKTLFDIGLIKKLIGLAFSLI